MRVAKSFQNSPIAIGTSVRLRITITAPTDIGVSGITFTDTLPAGLEIVSATANQCGGTVTTDTTGVPHKFTLTGGAIATANTSCNVDVNVKSQSAGSYPNTILAGDITTSQVRTNTSPSNTAILIVSGFSMSKAFFPTGVNANGISTLTFTLTNTSR